ncbi:MAG: hypothetical protein A3F40_03435 [Chlamydiae bacterium RIFCSPHIGHO2_12_FULL_27_8]|nr:MAG: hypothetical protein A3F40_03435 [Chlamydiae bacterium RIFCSPHIGHO2_12_FULL_27_8]
MKKLLFLAFVSLSLYSYDCPGEKPFDPCSYDADLFKKCKIVNFINAEFLYWRASAPGMEYAVKNRETPPVGTTYALGEYEVENYSFDPGFRASFGYFNAPHYWQAYIQYTWINIKNSKSTARPDNGLNLNSTFPQSDITAALDSVSSKVKLEYQLLEFMTSRVFIPNPHLRLRVVGGLQGVFLKNHWDIDYFYITSTNEVRNMWRYFSGGLRLGFDLDWFLGKDFYLSGKTTTAAVIGNYKNHSLMNTSFYGQSTLDATYEDYRVAYNIQYLFGFSYQKSFVNNRLELFLGYELGSWFNLHEIIKSTGGTNAALARVTNTTSGPLTMQGATFRFGFDF